VRGEGGGRLPELSAIRCTVTGMLFNSDRDFATFVELGLE